MSMFWPVGVVSARIPFGWPEPVPLMMACSFAFTIAFATFRTNCASNIGYAMMETSSDMEIAQRSLWYAKTILPVEVFCLSEPSPSATQEAVGLAELVGTWTPPA